ncbi:hypothetical protein FRC07_000063 [Ceratobasidium sp. 392]|nr:hypothetical protein FRC07_000063 [Ceratobasidium sp. 392]
MSDTTAIKSIDKDTIHKITSGQVVVDLATAVKELVENKVKFKDQGLTSIEVIDDGTGINKIDYPSIARKHHTSKISQLSDLTSVETFGFRGEALASLCAMCERVTITTATAEEAPMGTVLQFARSGELQDSSKKTARQRGTSVLVEKLFAPLPVRRRELERMIRRDYARALQLMQAYALVPCVGGSWSSSDKRSARGVRLTVSNQSGKGARQNQVQSAPLAQPNATVDPIQRLKSNISLVWGPKTLEHFVPLNLEFAISPDKSVLRRLGKKPGDAADETTVRVRGLISKFSHMSGRLTSERQFYYLNGRPFEPKQIQKAFNEVYKSFNSTQMPMIVADFQLPGDTFDINVSPDKRMIMLHNENELIAALKASIEEEFASTRSTYQVNDGKLSKSASSKNDITTPNDTQTKLNVTRESVRPAKKPRVSSPDEDVEEMVVEPTSDESPSTSKTTTAKPASSTAQRTPSVPSTFTLAPSAQPEFIPSSAFSSPAKAKTIQAVLSTSAASWNRRMSSQSPAKLNEGRQDTDSPSKEDRAGWSKGKNSTGAAARSALRERLAGMALKGSQPVVEEILDDDEEDDEVDELEEDEEAGEASRDAVPMDVDQEDDTTTLDPHDKDQNALVTKQGVAESEEETGKEKQKNNEKQRDENADTGREKEKDKDAPRPAKKPRQRHPSPEPDKRPTEFVKGGKCRAVRCTVDIRHLKLVYQSRAVQAQSKKDSPSGTGAASVSETNWEEPDSAQAELSLSRVIQKKDFLAMDILGQFNLGFVIVRLKKQDESSGVVDDLFIIDQHAADEKFNFERLQRTTKIQSQRLIRPRLLELSIVDELTALDNLDVLKKNGFVVQVDKDAPEGERPKLRLAAQPSSKDTMFDMKDLEEILHQMQEGNPSDTVRCSKARAMFAMRACRSSIMIGTALKQRHMANMVRNLAGMDLPWNCPHGRPTMRHLCNLRAHAKVESPDVNWTAFAALDV